jgi:GntR family transcriptional regulator
MIKVDTSSFVPIYEQIKKEFKKEIFREDLKPNDPLPSIRDLATELLINPNTVARAYRELEMEGFIYTRKGKVDFSTWFR